MKKRMFEHKGFLIFIGFIILYFILSKTVFGIFMVVEDCMEDTAYNGDILAGSRLNKDPERYDLVFFKCHEDGRIYIKRVIGMPGETILVERGHVYADGQILDSSFVKSNSNFEGDGEYEVPDGCYFVMGDNRDVAFDSRYWEDPYMKKSEIKATGKFYRVLPFDRRGTVAYDGKGADK